MSKISHTTKRYSEGFYLVAGLLLCFMAVLLLMVSLIATAILGFIGVLMLTSRYKLDLNTDEQKIEDYLWVLGAKTQLETFKYSTLFYIYINKKSYTQQMNYKSLSSTKKGVLYTAYLKSDKGNHYLGESENEVQLIGRLSSFANTLRVEIRSSHSD